MLDDDLPGLDEHLPPQPDQVVGSDRRRRVVPSDRQEKIVDGQSDGQSDGQIEGQKVGFDCQTLDRTAIRMRVVSW